VTKCENLNYSHIYSYNVTWNDDLMEPLINILNKSSFKVLVWAKNPRHTIDAGLNVEVAGQVRCSNAGGEG
jgi:hypothetical protein